MNNAQQIGRVGREIELRHTPKGDAVCEVTLAVDDGFGDKKKTFWFVWVLWGKTAETAAKFLSKGDMVGFSGATTQDTYEKGGVQQSKTRFRCDKMTLLPNGKDRSSRPAPSQHDQAKANGYAPKDDSHDEIPF
jgi:single-strand DNA-binding protein